LLALTKLSNLAAYKASKRVTDSAALSGMKCAQVSRVIVAGVWPRTRCNAFIEHPPASMFVAKKCRRIQTTLPERNGSWQNHGVGRGI